MFTCKATGFTYYMYTSKGNALLSKRPGYSVPLIFIKNLFESSIEGKIAELNSNFHILHTWLVIYKIKEIILGANELHQFMQTFKRSE